MLTLRFTNKNAQELAEQAIPAHLENHERFFIHNKTSQVEVTWDENKLVIRLPELTPDTLDSCAYLGKWVRPSLILEAINVHSG